MEDVLAITGLIGYMLGLAVRYALIGAALFVGWKIASRIVRRAKGKE